AQTAHPITQSKNFVNNDHDRRFILALRINNERLDCAIARFDFNPFTMTRRIVESRLRPILSLPWCDVKEEDYDPGEGSCCLRKASAFRAHARARARPPSSTPLP